MTKELTNFYGINIVCETADKESVIVNKNIFLKLIKSDLLLTCLNQGGVDNWDWYGEAYEEYEKDFENLTNES